MSSVLVTGGAGFLGFHLIQKLINDGNRVWCMDNFSTGTIQNVNELSKLGNFEFIQHDVTSPYKIKVDEIYNLACPASPIQYQLDPIQTLRTNFLGMYHALENAKEYNSRVVQASTSEVYGNPLVHPQEENYWGNVNPMGVRSCYDEGKRAAETMCSDYSRLGIDVRVMRIFNTYGPRMRQDDGRVVSTFIVQALRGDPITIFGKGDQTRSFCYADDLINGMQKLMDLDTNPKKPINIGNPVETSMLELASKIIELTSSSSELIYKKLPTDDPDRRKPNIETAREILGWKPTCDLQEGLLKTIGYFRREIGVT